MTDTLPIPLQVTLGLEHHASTCRRVRLAHAKRTLNTRKFPKREQKIIVAYKGDISAIPDNFRALGRL
jgi:hypothetical protein